MVLSNCPRSRSYTTTATHPPTAFRKRIARSLLKVYCRECNTSRLFMTRRDSSFLQRARDHSETYTSGKILCFSPHRSCTVTLTYYDLTPGY